MDPDIKLGLEAVVEHLRQDGFDARLGDDCAYLGVGDAALVILWSQIQSAASGLLHSAAFQVALRLRVDRPPLFEDVVTHIGQTREQAITYALLQVWMHGDLPPILPLLGGPMPPDVTVITPGDELYCPPWVIYSGPYQVSGQDRDGISQAVIERPPLLAIRDILATEVEPTALHWLKLFRSREDDDSDHVDCLLDGMSLPAGHRALAEWDWPPLAGRNSFRQFFVLLPEDRM